MEASRGNTGYIARSVNGNAAFGERLSGQAVFDVVAKRGAMIAIADLQPHDLRRTYAQLGFEAGIRIVRISLLLGHANVATTQRYLNLELDLERTISDVIPLDGETAPAEPLP